MLRPIYPGVNLNSLTLGRSDLPTFNSPTQIPANQEYPAAGSEEPLPSPTFFIESTKVIFCKYFTLLYPSCRATRTRKGAP